MSPDETIKEIMYAASAFNAVLEKYEGVIRIYSTEPFKVVVDAEKFEEYLKEKR